MRQRLFISILVALALIYLAIPRLPIGENGLAHVFSLSWLLFALVVIGGNLVGLLYSKNRQISVQNIEKRQKDRNKIRRYSS